MAQRRAKTQAHLEVARALIDKPQKWASAWGGGRNGVPSVGGRRSFYDAVYDATQVSPHPTPEFRALGRALGGTYSVDRLLAFERDHNHRDLMDLFDRAIRECSE
jgi:hypothetical protein